MVTQNGLDLAVFDTLLQQAWCVDKKRFKNLIKMMTKFVAMATSKEVKDTLFLLFSG